MRNNLKAHSPPNRMFNGHPPYSLFHLFLLPLSTLVLSLIASCNRPACHNTNIALDKYPADTKGYKEELIKQFEKLDKSKLTYWLANYREDNTSKYLTANVQGDGLCALIDLRVNDSVKGIERILKTKGIGYIGAELEDLNFEIKQNSGSTEFVFRNISGISD